MGWLESVIRSRKTVVEEKIPDTEERQALARIYAQIENSLNYIFEVLPLPDLNKCAKYFDSVDKTLNAIMYGSPERIGRGQRHALVELEGQLQVLVGRSRELSVHEALQSKVESIQSVLRESDYVNVVRAAADRHNQEYDKLAGASRQASVSAV